MKTQIPKNQVLFLIHQTSQVTFNLFIIFAFTVIYAHTSFGQSCPTSPTCPTDQSLTIMSDNSGPNQWVQSNNLVNNGTQVMIIPPGNTSATFNSWFSSDFNLGTHVGRILQHTTGTSYSLGSGNKFTFLGTELGTPAAGQNFSGLSSTWDNYRAVFGLVDDAHSGSQRNGSLLWQDNTTVRSNSVQMLRFTFRDNSNVDYDYATILSANGNFGINSTAPLNKLEVNGGVYVGSGATVTAGTGKLYVNQAVRVGSDAFMSATSSALTCVLCTDPAYGAVGIGTNSPSAQLHVIPYQNYNPGIVVKFDYLYGSSTTQEAIRINNYDGNVGIHQTSPSEPLDVGGNVKIGGDLKMTGTVRPTADNSYDLGDGTGSNTYYWRNIYCRNGTIITSDKNFKKDINDLDYGLTQIMKLKPISYHWKDKDNGRRLGFIAQDVKEIVNEVVVENIDSNGISRFGMRYNELIPVLVKGMQEQQQIIQTYQASVIELQNKLSDLQKSVEVLQKGNSNLNGQNNNINLYQNEPNPFSTKTTIKYSINTSFNDARIEIRDINAQLVSSFTLENKQGAGSVEFDGSTLNRGGYAYSLIVDGKLIDVKKLLITY